MYGVKKGSEIRMQEEKSDIWDNIVHVKQYYKPLSRTAGASDKGKDSSTTSNDLPDK